MPEQKKGAKGVGDEAQHPPALVEGSAGGHAARTVLKYHKQGHFPRGPHKKRR
jgi:hypothetical protein